MCRTFLDTFVGYSISFRHINETSTEFPKKSTFYTVWYKMYRRSSYDTSTKKSEKDPLGAYGSNDTSKHGAHNEQWDTKSIFLGQIEN